MCIFADVGGMFVEVIRAFQSGGSKKLLGIRQPPLTPILTILHRSASGTI
jgi:hypothetical protein